MNFLHLLYIFFKIILFFIFFCIFLGCHSLMARPQDTVSFFLRKKRGFAHVFGHLVPFFHLHHFQKGVTRSQPGSPGGHWGRPGRMGMNGHEWARMGETRQDQGRPGKTRQDRARPSETGRDAWAPLSNLQLVLGRNNIGDVGLYYRLCRHSNKFYLINIIKFTNFRPKMVAFSLKTFRLLV